jgi:hypothetical protein
MKNLSFCIIAQLILESSAELGKMGSDVTNVQLVIGNPWGTPDRVTCEGSEYEMQQMAKTSFETDIPE